MADGNENWVVEVVFGERAFFVGNYASQRLAFEAIRRAEASEAFEGGVFRHKLALDEAETKIVEATLQYSLSLQKNLDAAHEEIAKLTEALQNCRKNRAHAQNVRYIIDEAIGEPTT